MARPLSKTLTTTRVEYKTVEVVDGVPQFVDRPDAVFSGILEKDHHRCHQCRFRTAPV